MDTRGCLSTTTRHGDKGDPYRNLLGKEFKHRLVFSCRVQAQVAFPSTRLRMVFSESSGREKIPIDTPLVYQDWFNRPRQRGSRCCIAA